MRTALARAIPLLLIATFLTALPADAQILNRIKERAKQRAEQRAEEAADRAMDRAESALDGSATGTAADDDDAPGSGAWANYDFIPGPRVLAYHDFQDIYVGNFPDRMTFIEGNMEVVEFADGNRALRTNIEGRFAIPLPEVLPERFTIEFRVWTDDYRSRVLLFSGDDPGNRADSPQGSLAAIVTSTETGIKTGKYKPGPKATEPVGDAFTDQWMNVRIAVDGGYWKMYANEKRVANVPQVTVFPRAERLVVYFSIYRNDDDAIYLDDFRIAEGGRSILYDELQANGKIVTQGILFDTGSDRLRPESTPTLLAIARMLDQHADLNLRIEGHTDDTGDAALNEPLSQRRAQSVVDWLTAEHGIAADRLRAEGFGSRRPLTDNTTPERRQENRRVELHTF